MLGASWNVTALRLLVVGLALMLVGDAIYAADVLERLGRDTLVADVLLLTGVVAIGLAGLHRTMTALTEGRTLPSSGSTLLASSCWPVSACLRWPF